MAEPTTLIGRRLPATREGPVRDAVADVLDASIGDIDGESVVVIPDVHYPFHPSTGLVTHPAVVSAIVSELGHRTDADVVVGCRSGRMVPTAATARLLGYRRHDLELLDLDGAETVTRRASVRDGTMAVDLPQPLDEAAVVVVPTLRTDPDLGLALGMATLARSVWPDGATAEEAWAVAAHCAPEVTVVDAGFSFLGRPRETGFLLAGDDIVAVDAVVAGASDRSPTYLDRRAVKDLTASHAVEGLAPQEAADLTTEPTPAAGQPGRLTRTAYRLYAGLADDGIPPQFLG